MFKRFGVWYATYRAKKAVEAFHTLYYESGLFEKTFWLGVPSLKCPLDLWMYQEMLVEQKPDVIIETGTAHGGSALFLASICDLLNHGRILTIDIREGIARPHHPRISYLTGSSTSEAVLDQVQALVKPEERVMVILDSNHHQQHVRQELEMYRRFVSKDSYFIVEDTNVNGHPVNLHFGPGPMEAVVEFLRDNSDFVVDREKEKFFMTFNSNGYLRKIR